MEERGYMREKQRGRSRLQERGMEYEILQSIEGSEGDVEGKIRREMERGEDRERKGGIE